MDINGFLGKATIDTLREYDITVSSIDQEPYAEQYSVNLVYHSPFNGDISFKVDCKDKFDFANQMRHQNEDGYNLSFIGVQLQELNAAEALENSGKSKKKSKDDYER